MMEKLENYLAVLFSGRQIKGLPYIPPFVAYELYDVFRALKRGEKTETISGTTVAVLEKCGISTTKKGIGWEVAT